MARSYAFRRLSDGRVQAVMPAPTQAWISKNGSILVKGWADENRAVRLVTFNTMGKQVKRVLGLPQSNPLPEGAVSLEFTLEDL